MKKFGAIFGALLFGLLVAAATYAYWSTSLTISGTVGTGVLDANITGVTTGDNEVQYNVADVDVTYAAKSATITINNSYPGYVAWANFSITNEGTIPIKLSDTINNLYPAELNITTTWTGLDANGVLAAGATAYLNVTVEVTQNAAQNATYTFTVNVTATQFNAQ